MNIIEKMILRRAKDLIETAERYGMVVRIETIPQEPLAMGNYQMHATVQEKRVPAIPYDKLDGFVSRDIIDARKWRDWEARTKVGNALNVAAKD
jgi:hypothetical protein